MANTKHHIIRLKDTDWNLLADKFRLVVPSERRGKQASASSNWQITEGLRMIASGEITLTIIETPDHDE